MRTFAHRNAFFYLSIPHPHLEFSPTESAICRKH